MITPRSERVYLFTGLSTDQKPNNKFVGSGSVYIEMDTSKAYIYDESSKNWTVLNLGGGGGGGGTTYTAGKNINISSDNVISASYGLEETITSDINVGGIEKGDTFEEGTNIDNVIKALLEQTTPVQGTLYYGAVDSTSPEIDDLHSMEIPSTIKTNGITLNLTTSGKQYQCFIYPKEIGELTKIVQNGLSDFNLIDSFVKSEIIIEFDPSTSIEYYCYCTNELALEETGAEYTFLF